MEKLVTLSPSAEAEVRRFYEHYMDVTGRKDKKRKHPSFEEFKDIVIHLRAWNLVVYKAIEEKKQISGGEG